MSLPADHKEYIAELIREIGVTKLTMPAIHKRLSLHYNMEMGPHVQTINESIKTVMRMPEFMKALKKANEAAGAGGKGKAKRARSPTKDKKEKRVKKEKKPEDYPKGAMSAFMLFSNDQRPKFKESEPDLKTTDVAKKIGEAWKNISDAEKERYTRLANADKERHEKEMEAYKAQGGKVFKRGAGGEKKSKKVKDPNAPKRALSAYFFFAAEFRAGHPEVAMTAQMAQAGAKWRAMSDAEKKPYEDKAAADKERYIKECAAKGINTSSKSAVGSGKQSDNGSSSSSSSDDDE